MPEIALASIPGALAPRSECELVRRPRGRQVPCTGVQGGAELTLAPWFPAVGSVPEPFLYLLPPVLMGPTSVGTASPPLLQSNTPPSHPSHN